MTLREISNLALYEDEFSNSVLSDNTSKMSVSKIIFSDKNSKITVGARTVITHCSIRLGTNSDLVIGSDCRISGNIVVGAYSQIIIGNDFNVTSNVHLRAVEKTFIKIGNDCLFGTNVTLRTADGHPIYDRKTRERINKSASIEIEDHVWLADEVMVMKGLTVGRSSVLGARSLLTKSVPRNAVWGGVPAKSIYENIVWEHSPKHYSPDYYKDEDDIF
jgi:acetyltransferase-like isoleucine patch superfamily enzyme